MKNLSLNSYYIIPKLNLSKKSQHKPISCEEKVCDLSHLEKISKDKSRLLNFDSFWNDAEIVSKASSLEDVKSSMFHVNKYTFMKQTKMIKLKKRKDKTVFLDTVVLGIVFQKPKTKSNLDSFKKKTKKDIYNFWSSK